MKPILRFVTRLADEGDGLIVGSVLKCGRDHFKPNTIYELIDICGTVTLREVGESLIGVHNHKESPFKVTWSSEIEYILACMGKYLLICKEEYEELQKSPMWPTL
jgi:hypothetical protein